MAKADILRRVRQNLYSARAVEHPWLQEATAPVSTVATTFDVDDGTVWEQGDILEWEETGEQCYVRSVATNTLTVIRSFGGTTAASITDSVPLVRKNPQFTEQEILDQYDHILGTLWGHGIFQWRDQSVLIGSSFPTPQVESLLDVRPNDVVAVTCVDDDGRTLQAPFRLKSYTDGTDLYTDVEIYWPWEVDGAVNGQVHFVSSIDNIDTNIFHPEVEQVIEDGVTYRVMASTMASRLHDPGYLTDRTIQPGQGGRDARFFQGEFIMGVRRIAQQLKVERANRRIGQDYGTSRARRWRV